MHSGVLSISAEIFSRGADLLERDDIVTRLDIGDALSNRLHDTRTLVSQNDGECTFWVFPRQCVRIYVMFSGQLFRLVLDCAPVWQTPV